MVALTHTFTAADVMNARLELAKRGECALDAIGIPRKLIPVFDGEARYRGAYGGRGSGKTRTFAKMTAVRGDMFATQNIRGVILCAREFQNSLDDSSFAEVKAAIMADPYLTTRWEIGATYIRHVTRNVEYVFRGLRHNRESLKGLARILIAWPDEAEQITEESWQILIPTVREAGSEIWVTWNPASERSATHQRFRIKATDDMKIVEMNWTDNPWFPPVLNEERLRDKDARPDDYEHIWEGGLKTAWKGSYFAKQLADARAAGRIGYVDRHPNMAIRTYWDLGRKDHTSIWVCQWVDSTVRMIDHIAGSGQSPGYYFEELRSRGYAGCHVGLPHDGAQVPPSSPDGLSYEDQARQAGFDPEIIKSGNKAAPMQRIDAARKVFPFVHFDKDKCAAGLKSLAAYREDWHEEKQVGLGPRHDWASHDADAFGLMCVDYEEPKTMYGNGDIEVENYAGW